MTKKNSKTIALYFGTFDPVHIGHLAIANYISQYTSIDEVWMVVSPLNPLKKNKKILANHHRMTMLNIALEETNFIKACDIEFSMPIPSYTIDTLARLSEKYPTFTFKIVIGEDNLVTFNRWKNYEQILSSYGLLVYPRKSDGIENFVLNHPNVSKINAPQIEISSTFIRESIRKGKDVRYFLHSKVWNYVEEMNFYKK